ncbi:Allantoate permease [Friedmanniomyces endolithicus]|uniref:Allantoate permease n=1 Tax=Friedmanniomyces endolithicus TaxID=329885 RepID=A0AAN6FI16_9PEZI|nr:Allantoate permease [Friedmanniomyces endolithicus]KAK0287164.1 Allantoate permease [Friedmanniomyces endolithicus]KAK0317580.1 Allantoate permease [Friedmanniomyces endolithicus]KAK0994160.1 Allantoate permease [Friedmanniomyces endolithicus]
MSYDEKQIAFPPEVEKTLPAPSENAVRHGSVSEDVLKHSHDADEAMKAFAGHTGEIIEIDEATNKRLLRIIDFNLIPIMCIVYGLNFLDKTTISYASIMGLKKDTGLVGNDYQWLGSMFYFGYIAWEYPTNRLLQRLPIGKYSAACVIAWGLVLSCFAAVNSFAGAVAIRFMLGVCEAAVTPGFALITSQWYTRKEQGARTGIWFSFNGWAQIFGGLVAYGIAKGTANHQTSIAGWKIVFLLTGLLTVVVGIIFLFTVPDNQLNARWLSKEDRILALERIRINQQGVGNKHFKWYQVREALLDPITWAFFLYALIADIPNGGLSNFFSQLITSFGYTAEQSLLYGTPGGAVEVITLIVGGWLGDRLGNRILVASFGMVASIIGMALIVGLPLDNNKGRLGGYYLTQAAAMPFVAFLSLISSNIAGYTKKTTVAAIYLIGYCIGNIIGPQTFRPKDAPRYVPAEIVIICCWTVCLGIMAFIYIWSRRQNTLKARIRAQPDYTKLENQEFLDLTDRENAEFVYSL